MSLETVSAIMQLAVAIGVTSFGSVASPSLLGKPADSLRAMNATRLLVAILVVFATDFVIHSIWLMPDYNATKSLWRPESEMSSHFPFMLAAQFLFAAMLCVIWALGFAGRSLGTAIVFGLFMGLFQQVWPIATYVVMPLPGAIAVKWIISGVLQVILVTIVAALVYRPRASAV